MEKSSANWCSFYYHSIWRIFNLDLVWTLGVFIKMSLEEEVTNGPLEVSVAMDHTGSVTIALVSQWRVSMISDKRERSDAFRHSNSLRLDAPDH